MTSNIDIIFSWFIVVPLSAATAFLWHWPVWAVTLCLNIDQFIKCVINGIKTNRYTWIKKLARQ